MSTIIKAPTPILIFDIETVPDIALAYHNYKPTLDFDFDITKHWNDLRVIEAISTQKKVNFLPTIFHTVLSVCGIYVNPETFMLMDGFKKTIPTVHSAKELYASEKQVLQEFWNYAVKYQSSSLKHLPVTFCGYNISGFDLPVIEQRSLKSLITCPIPEYALLDGTGSYRYKFASDKVFDLCAFVSNHQPQARPNLDTLAYSLGLAGKMEGMHGSKVAEAYFVKNEWEKIEEYCAIDVLITYGVFLAIQKFRGAITDAQYKNCQQHFYKFLTQEGKPTSYKALANNSSEFFNNME